MDKFNLSVLFLAWISAVCSAEVTTSLPTADKVVAITFDACETKNPAYFDQNLLSYLIREKLPVTLFVGGRFARRNRDRLSELSTYDFIEIENHSFNHPQHMESLTEGEIKEEILSNQDLLESITAKKTRLFRFPGGNYDSTSLAVVESLGYKVVHWSFESGDPNPKWTTDGLFQRVVSKTKPGSILIFHINGRGIHTAEALPRIVEKLRSEGYRFVKLGDVL
jgi:peptidoglycan/xylan/chitin deacetylase (PgdA/CDA1 family)